MISEIKIGNFKAFGPVQTVPLRPITLVFGPNSAGKSSIIQSLLLARHIHDTGKMDVHQTTLGGAAVDLGGFARFVHQRESNRETTIHLTFDRSEIGGKFHYLDGFEKLTLAYAIGLDRTGSTNSQVAIQSATLLLDDCELLRLVRLENGELHVDEAALVDTSLLALADFWTLEGEAVEQWKTLRGILARLNERRPGILREAEQYGLTSGDLFDPISGKPILKGARDIAKARMYLSLCDEPSEHPAALDEAARERTRPRTLADIDQLRNHTIVRELCEMKFRANTLELKLLNCLPEELPAEYEIEIDRPRDDPFRFYKRYLGLYQSDLEGARLETEAFAMALRYDLAWLIQSGNDAAGQGLEGLSYLGPLRWIPPRLLPEGDQFDASWVAGGGGAWQRLRREPTVLEQVNVILRDTLHTRYQLKCNHLAPTLDAATIEKRIRQVREKVINPVWPTTPDDEVSARVAEDPPIESRGMPGDADLAEMLQTELDARTSHGTLTELVVVDAESKLSLSHRDVGTGISQLLPVIVNAVASQKGLIAIEQPELHLHPALQAELGDVFIESALGQNKNTFLIETHSEHLILRLLRRVRETTDGRLPDDAHPLRADQVCVLFVHPGKNGSEVVHLTITPDGDFTQRWPGGFFAERAEELF